MTTNLPLATRLGIVLLGLAYLLPGHYLPWTAFQPQWLSALGALLVAGGLCLKPGSERLPLPALAALALALAVVPMLQHAFGLVPYFSDAQLASLYLAAFALALVAGATPQRTDAETLLTTLLGALLVAGAVSVALALAQWLQLGPFNFIADLRPGDRPFGNLAQPNHLATLLSLGVVALLHLFESRRLGAVGVLALLGWLGLGLVMTQSRTGWLSMGLLALWCLWQRRKLALRLTPAAVWGSGVVFVAAILSWRALNEWLAIGTGPLAERLTPGTRLLHWRALWDAVWLEPWTGYGWQQVALAQQRTVLDHAPSLEMIQSSHNLLLDLLVWNGVLIGVPVIAFVLWWFIAALRRCADPSAFVLVAAVGILGAHAMLEYPLEHSYFLLPLGLFAGLLEPWPGRALLPRPVFGAALAAMTGMLFWIGAEYLEVEQANRDVRLMLAGYGLDKVPEVPPPEVRLLDGPRDYHRFMIASARPGTPPAELDWMKQVVQRNAYPPAMMRYALAAGLNGRAGEAALTLRRLCHMHPKQRCEEARESWAAAQAQFPVLGSIPAP
jgi:O-antigen ligase